MCYCCAAVIVELLAVAAIAMPTAKVERNLAAVAGVSVTCPARWPHTEEAGGWYWPDKGIELRVMWCRAIGRTLAGQRPNGAGFAWHTFAHEVAHSLGYDHGTSTIGAQCAGWRMMRPLMRKAGLPRGYARKLWHERRFYSGCATATPNGP